MPTKLEQPLTSRAGQTRSYLRSARGAARPKQMLDLTGPWLGYAPDLPEILVGAQAFGLTTRGIRALSLSHGEVLTTDDGFEDVDVARLPLGANEGLGNPVVRLHSFYRTDESGQRGVDASGTSSDEYDITLMALVAGDGSNAGSASLWRVQPGDGQWKQCSYVANQTYDSNAEMKGDEDGAGGDNSMPHSAVFSAGSPSHDPNANIASSTPAATSLNLPVFVFTNNVDPVMVLPAQPFSDADGGRTKYTELHVGTSLDPFLAKTCFSWEGRMYYGNTSENGTRFPRRVRWGGLFDASPDESIEGSGYFDITEIAGTIHRFENLDPYLVVYFSDGIALIERTGYSIAPHRYRVITDHRGLLGPHAVAHISPTEHFIIATDGFFIFNANRQFREVGLVQDRGATYHKWHETFFDQLDVENTHRIQCHYDQQQHAVRIAFPRSDAPDTYDLWTYDIRSDRMWPESWTDVSQVRCFADHSAQMSASIAWNDPEAPSTWEGTTSSGGTTWASGAATFGRDFLHHGDQGGFVFKHSDALVDFTRDGVANPQSWQIRTAKQALGDPRFHTLVRRLDVEFQDLNYSTGTITATVGALAPNGEDIDTSLNGTLTQDFTSTKARSTGFSHIDGRVSSSQVFIRLVGNGVSRVGIRRMILTYLPSQSMLRY